MQPVQLFVNVLLREDKNIEFLTFDQVWTLCHLFDEHAQEVAPLLEKFVAIIPKTLLLGQRGNV